MRDPDDGLRDLLIANLLRLHCQTVELGLIAAGVPDLNYCGRGAEGWVECKATSGFAVKVRPFQVAWIERRLRFGGRVFVAVRRRRPGGPRRGNGIDELWLYEGQAIRRLADAGLRTASGLIGTFTGGPSAWDWDEVTLLLTR